MNDSNADANGGSRRGTIAALIVVVLLVLGGLWVAHTLRGVSNIQDCAMAGRTNCAGLVR